MSEPKLGQTKKSAVESYLRAKREKGQLTDEEIARLDAIGFKWEKRKKKTIEEKVDLYVHYWESGIGSVTYWTIEVERRTEYKENEWLPCDESGRIDDGYGNEPDAIVAYFSSLEGSREERAFELAKNEYLAWLEHRTDRYTTVYGYMD